MLVKRKSLIADTLNYLAFVITLSFVAWLLYIDKAILECAQMGFLDFFLLYPVLLFAVILSGLSWKISGKRRSGKGLLSLVAVLALAPLFFETYGYDGPICGVAITEVAS